MIFLQLFIVFLQIGIFGFGGGYSMISLIQGQVVTQYHWMTMKEFTDVVAISQMTPGPIGINAATYCGYTAVHNAGMGGSPAVVALIAVPTFSLAKSARISLVNCWIPILSALLIWLVGVNPIWVIIAAGVGGYIYGQFIQPTE
jgi:chromate transporter